MKKSHLTFSPQQEKMYATLCSYVQKYKALGIERDNLIYFLRISNENLNSAIYRLNKQYKKVCNTRNNLIYCEDKINGFYRIRDVWRFNESIF